MKIKSHAIEIKHLRAFESVARHLSFTKAAMELHMAQPVLSRQIKDLEESLGVQLFDRNRVRVRMLPAAKAYNPYVAKILAQLDIAATVAMEAAKSKTTELTIGTDWRVTHPKVISAIMAFKKNYSEVELNIKDLSMPDQAEALQEENIDVAFLPKQKAEFLLPEFLCKSFVDLEMKVVLSSMHPLADREKISLGELSSERWVTLDGRDANGYRNFIATICRESGFTPNFIKTANNLQSLIGLVGSQKGICLLPDFVMPADMLLVKAISTDAPLLNMSAIYKRNPSKPVIDFLALLDNGSGA